MRRSRRARSTSSASRGGARRTSSRRSAQALVDTFVTALEREDIEALAGALYKIPKTVEKFAERYVLFADRLVDVDFASRAAMLEKAADVIVEMTAQLRAASSSTS